MKTIKEILVSHNIIIKREVGKELIVDCLLSDCDNDSVGNEAHMYINSETGAFSCKKCPGKGGYLDLMKLVGETSNTDMRNKYSPYNYTKYEEKIPQEILDYLVNKRGLTLETIKAHHLGVANFYNDKFITIPIFNEHGIYTDMYKLRSVRENNSPRYRVYPQGSSLSLYGLDFVNFDTDEVYITEGEFDCMLLHQENLNAFSVGAGVQTFKDDWLVYLKNFKKIYIWFDNDKAGIDGLETLRNKLSFKYPNIRLYKVNFPEGFNGKDITDLKVAGYSLIDLSKNVTELESFAIPKEEITLEELTATLGATIIQDDVNKVVTFLGMLSMYTNDSQINLMLSAPSSTGKSYIPIEISKFFPQDDLIQLAYASPTAFFHDQGAYDDEKNLITIDFHHKTIIFLDQQNSVLLERLRPILSHDKEEVMIKITDKNLKGGNKTKNVLMKGFPAVIFCTASTRTDEQELTRLLVLSPETTQDKIKFSIKNKMSFESNKKKYSESLNSNIKRQELIKRILAIKYSGVKYILVNNWEDIFEKFIKAENILKPRHQRDAGRLIQLIESFALLNLWNRKRIDNQTIEASAKDIENALIIWDKVSLAQDLEIPPYVLIFLKQVISIEVPKSMFEKPMGEIRLQKLSILNRYKEVYKHIISPKEITSKYLDPLVNSGILEEIKSLSDGRVKDYVLTDFGLEKINRIKE